MSKYIDADVAFKWIDRIVELYPSELEDCLGGIYAKAIICQIK